MATTALRIHTHEGTGCKVGPTSTPAAAGAPSSISTGGAPPSSGAPLHTASTPAQRKGVLHVHIVQARHLSVHRRPTHAHASGSAAAAAAAATFSLSFRVGSIASLAAPSSSSSSSSSSSPSSSPPVSVRSPSFVAHASHRLSAPSSGEAVWNSEVELPLANVDHWLQLIAVAVPPEEPAGPLLLPGTEVGGALKRRMSGRATPTAATSPGGGGGGSLADRGQQQPRGEVRLPLKEYDSGVFHDVWVSFRRPPSSLTSTSGGGGGGGGDSGAYVRGEVHVRFMYQLASIPAGNSSLASADQSCMSRLPSPIGAFAHHLLASKGYWLHVLLQHLDHRNSEGGGSDASRVREVTGLLQAILTVLAHARFGLLLHVIDGVVRRELAFLAEQQSGRVDSVWASNLFRRNSIAAKMLAMYCANTAAQPTAASHPPSSSSSSSSSSGVVVGVRSGVGKQYLLQVLSPFVHRIVKDVTEASAAAASTPSANNDAASNPYEIDSTKLAHHHGGSGGDSTHPSVQLVLERNQDRLLQRCQELLDAVVGTGGVEDDQEGEEGAASSSEEDGAGPSAARVPASMKRIARQLHQAVCEFVAQAPTSAVSPPPTPTPSTTTTMLAALQEEGEEGGNDDSVNDIVVAPPPSAQAAAASAAASAEAARISQLRTTIAHESSHNSLASFFFLRFLCPALVTPVHYGILQRPPSANAARALILVAKAMQSLVNSAGSVVAVTADRQRAEGAGVISETLLGGGGGGSEGVATHGRTEALEEGGGAAGGGEGPAAIALLPLDESFSSLEASDVGKPIARRTPNPAPTTTTIHTGGGSTPSAGSSSSRLFKESYMEFFYPWINRNLSRVHSFLGAFPTVSRRDLEVLPGVVEEYGLVALGHDDPAADEKAQVRELERSLWLIQGFCRAHLTALCVTGEKMLASGALPLPKHAAGQPYGGAHAMRELTRGEQSDLLARAPSGLTTPAAVLSPSSSTPVALPSPSSSSSSETGGGASSAAIAAFLGRFRACVESMTPPPGMLDGAPPTSTSTTGAGAGTGGPAHPKQRGHEGDQRSASFSVGTTIAGSSILAAAANSGLKFFQRFLPNNNNNNNSNNNSAHSHSGASGGKDRSASSTATAASHPSSAAAAASSADSSAGPPGGHTTPSKHAHHPHQAHASPAVGSPSPPLFPASPLVHDGVGSMNSLSHASGEDWTFFKQASVEIQLRLSEQLEESEAARLALQKAYEELEAAAWQKDETIKQLRDQLAQLGATITTTMATTTMTPSAPPASSLGEDAGATSSVPAGSP